MNSKILAAIVLIGLFVPSHFLESPPLIEGDDNIINEITKLLEKFKEILDVTVSRATTRIRALQQRVKQLADQFLNEAKKEIDARIADVLQRLETLEKQAANQGIDISECLVLTSKLKNLPQKITQQSNLCTKGVVNTLDTSINNSLNHVQNFTRVIDTLYNELKTCGTQPICLGKLFARVISYVSELPVKVLRIIKEAAYFSAQAGEDLSLCGVIVANGIHGLSKLGSISTRCIIDVIEHKNKTRIDFY